ncbi:MAG: hypothetical protein P0Y56_08290 [Candidatus Andeanibacterium colombiense]|uniref:Uncharacterized protein n=1 Tax=Candidatus Andeanibacterium colombiense TaxID=3121345 RepID=A0AAJ6BP94_9SPHN|nr:MAG: hypothetical protein P0Y56_08290 [Sphingomonadaceae bacterium]
MDDKTLPAGRLDAAIHAMEAALGSENVIIDAAGMADHDTKNESQACDAYAATKAMLEPAAKLGYGEYRSHVDFMDEVASVRLNPLRTPSTLHLCEKH